MNSKIIWFELAAFISSWICWPVIKKSKFLRIYPFLLLLVVTVEGYYSFIAPLHTLNAPVYNVQVPLQYLCYILILYYSAESPRTRRFLVAGFIVILTGNLITGLYFTPEKFNNVWGYSICSLVATIGIVLKLYEMATTSSTSTYDFLRDPFFYLLFAYLFFNLFTLPYFSMANWLHYTGSYQQYKGSFLILFNLMSICNYLLYTTYSIAFVWIARRKVTY